MESKSIKNSITGDEWVAVNGKCTTDKKNGTADENVANDGKKADDTTDNTVTQKGRIKLYVHKKGYGFITSIDNEAIENKDIFFHRLQQKPSSNVNNKTIKVGRFVSFALNESRTLKVDWFSIDDDEESARKWPKDVNVTPGKQLGKVKWFNPVKGWGFLEPAGGGEDVFVHQSNIIKSGFRSLREGEEVEYELIADTVRSRTIAGSVSGPNGSDVQGSSHH